MLLKAIAVSASLFVLPSLAVEAAPLGKTVTRSDGIIQAGMGRYGPKKFYRHGRKWDKDAAIKSKCIHPTQKCRLEKS
jgi:hypothetical protein